MTGRNSRKRQLRAGEQRISFEPENATLSLRLAVLARLFRGKSEEVKTGTVVSGSLLAVGTRIEIGGTIDGHVVAVDSEVVLARGAHISGYLYLVDSQLDLQAPWDSAQHFHSESLPQPWRTIVVDARDCIERGASGELRTWRLERDEPQPRQRGGTSISVDTNSGATSIEGDPSSGNLLFLVDGVDRSDWLAPFTGQPLTFNGGPLFVFGGNGARFNGKSKEWTIPCGNIVAVAGDGYAVLGARTGVRYQPQEGVLVATDAVMRCHFAGGDASYEGRELIYRMADASVEVQA